MSAIVFRWKYRENACMETAKIRIGEVTAYAADCDGDLSHWHVKRGDLIIAEGEESGFEPYHFEVAKEKAIAELEKLGLTPADQKAWIRQRGIEKSARHSFGCRPASVDKPAAPPKSLVPDKTKIDFGFTLHLKQA